MMAIDCDNKTDRIGWKVAEVRYIDVEWLHADAEHPVRIVSEIGADGYGSRKMEFFADGRIGHATETTASGDTELGDQFVPPIEDINAQGEFRGAEFDAAVFEALWRQHVG